VSNKRPRRSVGAAALASGSSNASAQAKTRLALQLNLKCVDAPSLSKACERIENESRGEYETEHHSNNLRRAPFTHYGRYYSTNSAAQR